MARNRQGPIRRRTETAIHDEDGNPIYVANYTKETIIDPADNSVESVTRAESTTLASGESFNPSMSAGQNPVMLTGVCELCRQHRPLFPWSRRRNPHGLTNLEHLKRCRGCGKPLCPRHRHRGRDRSWRCPACHRLYRLRKFLGGIFFEVE